MSSEPRVKIPAEVAAGEVFTIKTLFRHRMETGRRVDADGATVPRDIVNRFEARLDGELVFAVDLHPGVAANPYIEFTARIERPGTFALSWTDDAGEVVEVVRDVAVAG